MKSIRSPFIAAALAVLCTCAAGPLMAEEAKMSRVFRIPPDFLSHGAISGRCSHHPHIIPALGSRPPVDARPLLEELGVQFGKGDVALVPENVHQFNILFVRTSPEQMDLVETLTDQMGGGEEGPIHSHITYCVQETTAGGRMKELLNRTVLIRSGQRVKFQRHRDGKLVEQVELEASVEDGLAEVNSALEFHFKGLSVKTTGLVTVGTEAKEAVVVHRGRGRSPRSQLEVLVSAKRVCPLPGEGAPKFEESWLKQAAVIDGEVTAAEKQNAAPAPRTELMSLDLSNSEYAKVPGTEVKLPDGTIGNFVDARAMLKALRIPLMDEERAWYWSEGRLLFLHAGEKMLSAVERLAKQQERDVSYEVKFAPVETKREEGRPYPARTLLIRAGQRAKGTTTIEKDRPEATEAELSINEARTVADVDLGLENLSFGKEIWSFNCWTVAATDGTHPVTLVSGRAADSGGGSRSLQLTVNRRRDYWRDLLNEPAQKAALLGAVAGTLLPAGERK